MSRLAAMGLPTASKFVVDEVIGRQRADRLSLIAALAGTAVAIEAAAGYAAAQIAGRAGQQAMAELRHDLQTRMLGWPLRYLQESSTAGLAARVLTDAEQVRYLVGNGLVQLVASSLTATFALALLFNNAPFLTSCLLLVVAVIAVAVGRSIGGIAGGFAAVLRYQSELVGHLSQVLGGIAVVKAYAAERHEAARLTKQSHQLVRESLVVLQRVSLLNAGTTLAAGAIGLLVLVVGGGIVAAGEMSLGSYVMYVWLSGLVLGPVFHVAVSSGDLGRSVAAAGRLADLRKHATELEEDRCAIRLQHLTGAVRMENVSYGYGPTRLALRDVSLNAPAGSMTAVVGPNGSGKTTLCRLLLAYDRPSSGRILIDNHDLATLSRRNYRSRLGVVLQEAFLFEGTIADNIRYGRPRASPGEVLAAACHAHCDEFISRLPEGYSTRVGERGMRLSAGQRQRVTIARALLVDPRILILDEATANLDAESELLIEKALRRLCAGRTTFVIAHRLSTIRGADQILVLADGVVVEQGAHDELVLRGGPYASTAGVHQLVGGGSRVG